MLTRLVLSLIPLLVLVTAGFALYYVYGAALAARAANWPFALFYLVLGFGGVALAAALGRMYWGIRTAARQAAREGGAGPARG